MKKMLCILGLSCLLLNGCAVDSAQQEDIYYHGKIATVEDDMVYLMGEENSDLIALSLKDLELFNQTEEVDFFDLHSGMMVKVSYDGTIMESYPARLSNPTELVIEEEAVDLVGLYREVIHEIYETDSDLNGERYIAYDFSLEQNLSAGEKSALMYLLDNDLQLETLEGTYDELVARGYIDDENLFFEDGVLITIKSERSDGDFTFSISKWRGGDGAIFFDDCKASLEDFHYTYELGAFGIS